MKLPQLVALVVLPGTALTFSPFRGANKPDTVSDGEQPPSSTGAKVDFLDVTVPADSKFNPSELLDFKAHKPEVYTKAMLELKRLEQEPICHRTAAQLLMDNCRGIEEIDTSDGQWGSAHIQRHHVESFANGLTMCDLERARFVTPEACNPFGSSALYRAARDKHSQLEISVQQVGDCLEALGRDHSHWSTWLSNRDKAVTICRAARLDIEKGEFDYDLLHSHVLTIYQIRQFLCTSSLSSLCNNLPTTWMVS